MKRLIPAVVLIAATAACGVPPTGSGMASPEAYDAAVASIGCVMENESQYRAVEFQTGMNREQTIQMGQYRMAVGAAEATAGGGVRLTSGACAA
ncbi:hypothetical protein ATO6_17540 [Oceanicola sp. 22II-s10i]|uniref:hypothetical protein n=1 Tax=Oceanicola sp. 22II-s10i TaxID=1317116 RepID=UPI000B521762|nr:hypothetical protein [Oceanicola sp. 22II-s10i]OWU83664.1 hypothetical protein ATO6_17540 [Oceanicola sp. 22II-s10i]